jgi:hypothetical protein
MCTFLRVAVSFLFLAHGGDNMSSGGGGGHHDAILLSSGKQPSNHYQHQSQQWLTDVINEG